MDSGFFFQLPATGFFGILIFAVEFSCGDFQQNISDIPAQPPLPVLSFPDGGFSVWQLHGITENMKKRAVVFFF